MDIRVVAVGVRMPPLGVLGMVRVVVVAHLAVAQAAQQILKTEVLVMLVVIRAVALISQVVEAVLVLLAQMVTVVLVVAVRAQLATF